MLGNPRLFGVVLELYITLPCPPFNRAAFLFSPQMACPCHVIFEGHRRNGLPYSVLRREAAYCKVCYRTAADSMRWGFMQLVRREIFQVVCNGRNSADWQVQRPISYVSGSYLLRTTPRKYILTHLLSPLLCPHSPLVWCRRGLSVSIGWLDPFCTALISQMGQFDGGAANGKLG